MTAPIAVEPRQASTIAAQQITATAHGLTGSDIGKPLRYPATIWSQSDTEDPSYILASVVDVNTVLVHTLGTRVADFPSSLLDGAYSLSADGPFVYWDASTSEYVAVKPPGYAERLGPTLQVVAADATLFAAIVRV